MKSHPILFSAPMVRAILDGTKTMTRRAVKPMPGDGSILYVEQDDGSYWPFRGDGDGGFRVIGGATELEYYCSYGEPGDTLWVRETFARVVTFEGGYRSKTIYRATDEDAKVGPWTPSIFMSRHNSRIDLRVRAVRVERLQEITEADARAEGAMYHDGGGVGHSGWRHDIDHGYVYPTARDSFAHLWDSINAKRGFGWDANPWVWVIEFERIKPRAPRGAGQGGRDETQVEKLRDV